MAILNQKQLTNQSHLVNYGKGKQAKIKILPSARIAVLHSKEFI